MEQNNKLIAEFMGVNLITIDDIRANKNPYISSADGYTKEDLQYHSSWDWLMPVVHRIRDHVNMDMSFEEYDDWRENFKQIDPYNYSLEQCYKAVIEFIKNQND